MSPKLHVLPPQNRTNNSTSGSRDTSVRNTDGRWPSGHSGSANNQFKPGRSGNAGGRPRKKPIAEALQDLLARPYNGTDLRYKGLNYAQAVAASLMRMALAGNLRAIIEITDRVEGKVPNAVRYSGPHDGAIAFTPVDNEREIERLLALIAHDDYEKVGLEQRRKRA